MENQKDRDNDKPQDDSEDEASIISDQDESRMRSNVVKDEFTGPASSSLEASDFSDEFLAGEIDVREQMDKTTEAIQDALESELEEGPSPESD